jgi:3-carboxy-cis,cis-muconate cycloisomerase
VSISNAHENVSSSRSEELFGGIYARGDAAAETDDRGWLQAMLDVEAALARACAREATIPADKAEAIADACIAERFDLEAIRRGTAEDASPVVALVSALREAVGEETAAYVHLGATSQDIVDTAMMLIARRALVPLLEDAAACAAAAAHLADANRDTPMVGRTLLQQALPTSFGLRAAGWLVGLDESRRALAEIRAQVLAVQMGGPVGSRPPGTAAHVAAELGLAEPTLAWHAIRVRPAALASALGGVAGVLAKIARDVTLLAQDEVGEVRLAGSAERGASSAMAHKRNPVAAVAVLACTGRVPGLVATVLGGMAQEHERAAGSWQAEWGVLSDLLVLVGSAAAWGRQLLEQLEVVPGRMRENLARLAAAGVTEAGEPERHLGAAAELIDRALASHRRPSTSTSRISNPSMIRKPR